jgi:hypothetical protein
MCERVVPLRRSIEYAATWLRDAAKQQNYATIVDVVRQLALTGCWRGDRIEMDEG